MASKFNKDQFLEKAKKKFQSKFEYNLDSYKSLSSKISVLCKETDHFGKPHGWFKITAESHLKGKGGCKVCQYSKKYLLRNKKDFIHFAQKIHKNKYDYSEFNFINGKTKGKIKCDVKEHPDFYMHPNNHLSNKAGCKLCGRKRSGNLGSFTKHNGKNYLEIFLKNAPTIHKNKFDYSEVKKLSSLKTKDFVDIRCPIHGLINVQASVHMNGHDCYYCGIEYNANKKRKSQKIFIEECIQKWNYDKDFYSLVDYKGKAYEITLKCPIHGPFITNAGSHLQRGYGCKICSGVYKKSRDEIIQLSLKKHGGKYDYSFVEKNIQNVHQKITIVCKLHGKFKSKAIGHYKLGYGCPECGRIKSGVDNIKVFSRDKVRADSYCELYLVGVDEYFKIGIAEDTYKRDRLYSDFYLIEPSKRAICWCVEQYLLMKTTWMEPDNLPEKLSDWSGRQELRLPLMDYQELAEFMREVLKECKELGWEKFSLKYELPDYGYGWDPKSEVFND